MVNPNNVSPEPPAEETPVPPYHKTSRHLAYPQLYTKRWIMLALFCASSLTNGFQWMQYSAITNIIARYYDVSSTAVNWFSMVYMVPYVVLILPVNYLLDKEGLKLVTVIGAFGNALGPMIKLIGCHSSLFPVAMLGQLISGAFQVFILGIPSQLAAVWFGPKEVSTATAVGVFGNQVGIALGFLLVPVFVPNPDPWDERNVFRHLTIMYYVTSVVTAIIFLLCVFLFEDRPPKPPSFAQAIIVNDEVHENYVDSLKTFFTHRGFVLLFLTYGFNVGSFYGLSTLLNEVMLSYFPHEELAIGRVGLVIVLAGMLGGLLIGIFLDKYHSYKLSAIIIYVLSLVFMVAFTFTLWLKRLWLMYIIAALLGFFMTSYLPLGFEFAVEITYPLSEGTSAGLLNCAAQFMGIVIIEGMGSLRRDYGSTAANLLLCAFLLVGTVLTFFIKEELNRQSTERKRRPSARVDAEDD